MVFLSEVKNIFYFSQMEVSVSQENYLKAILKLEDSEGIATNQAISQSLDSTPAAVTGMLRKLLDEGWVEYEAYQGARLTRSGRMHALSTVRKHRLWEVFLVEKLKFPWESVHALAEELEHIGDVELTDRLDAFLGRPAYDPHGDAIPDAEGRIRERKHVVNAATIGIGSAFSVCGVSDSSAEFLRHLNELRVELGNVYEVTKFFDFDGSYQWSRDGMDTTMISREVAEKILIQVI
jgi:DtxR family Mn-dependent transcriptional regulator